MIHGIYSIYDEKAKAYIPPFFLPHDGMAVRTFKNCVNDPDHQFGRNPHDYTLFGLGSFDDGTGKLSPADHSISLGNGVEFITQQTQESVGAAKNSVEKKNSDGTSVLSGS